MKSWQSLSLFVLSLCVASLAPAESFTVAALMIKLAQANTGEVHFVEWKYSDLLTTPLQSSGTLRYFKGGRLEKHTLTPRVEDMVVEGDTLSVTGAKTRTVTLGEIPALRAFIESIRGTLAGDLPLLEHFYTLRLRGDELNWSLELEPKEREMRALVKSIRITGMKARLRGIEVFESSGDRSVMSILE